MDVVAHTCNPRTQKPEAGGSILGSRSVRTEKDPVSVFKIMTFYLVLWSVFNDSLEH